MTYQTDSRYPEPIQAGYTLLATSRNFDYFQSGHRIFSYGKTERGTRTTAFGDTIYWRQALKTPAFQTGVIVV